VGRVGLVGLAFVGRVLLDPAGAAAEPVTFSKDIAPIVYGHCVECHRPDGPGAFSLLSYADVRQRARQLAVVTSNKTMPPWKADAPPGTFIGQRPLSADQIALLQRWVDDGALEGDRGDLPPSPRLPGAWRLGIPDLVITLDKPFVLGADGQDVFRIFVVPIPTAARRFVRGLEFRPGNARVVHHANIRIDRTAASRQMDAADPEPGYDGLLSRSALFPDGHFLGWTPGQVAPLLPKGLAWTLTPGSDLVVQLHMEPSGKPELVQPSIGFYFGADPPERTPALLRLGRQSIDIPAGQSQYRLLDQYTLPVDVEVQAVQPHAHYRATEVRAVATLPGGTVRTLVHIRSWDFLWQHLYRYTEPFVLPKGTTLSMEYLYDNSDSNPRNPQRPPRPVVWGQRSSEEMGDLWIQMLVRDEADLLRLNRDFRPKAAAEDLVGYEGLISRSPADAALHDDAAALALELGRIDTAVAHFERSLQLRPRSATAAFNLGTALALAGKRAEAIAAFERAIAEAPEYANAHNSLGNALMADGRIDRAIDRYAAAIRFDPGHAPAHNNLGSALLQIGRPQEAIGHFEAAIALRAGYANALGNLGTALATTGQARAAVAAYRQAIAADPVHVAAHSGMAWQLATSPDETVRNPAEAVKLAERAAALTASKEPGILDVLAAAYAARGDYALALQTLEAAMALSPGQALAEAIRMRRALYAADRPYRQP